MTRCDLCHTPTHPDDLYREVKGWERKSLDPTRRGGSDIVLRDATGAVACPTCINRLRSGLSPNQEALSL